LMSDPHRLASMGAAARSRVLDRFGQARFAQAGAEVFARLPAKQRRFSPGEAP
ncbi:MAG: glycosyltransferase, partial [Caulobacter sp.]|nr:glycosyltransferase [Caulobacter sp.]